MHITRLPATLPQSRTDVPARAAVPFAGGNPLAEAPAPGSRRAYGGDDSGLQGEVLSHREARYQSTHAFLLERTLGRARAAGGGAGSGSPAAAGRYLDHAQSVARAEANQGRSLDLFI